MTIGFLFEDKVAVASGLEDIVFVVTEGAPYLIDGTQVKIVESDDISEEQNQPKRKNDEDI